MNRHLKKRAFLHWQACLANWFIPDIAKSTVSSALLAMCCLVFMGISFQAYADDPPFFAPEPSLASSVQIPEKIYFTGEACDNHGIQTITIDINGPKWEGRVYTKNVASSLFCHNLSRYYFDSNNAEYAGVPGNYEVYFYIKDVDSNPAIFRKFDVTVTKPTGSVKVTIKPSEARNAGAKWEVFVNDHNIWTGPYKSGYTANGLPVGSTSISFRDIDGWIKPSQKTVNIYADELTTTSGTYEKRAVSIPDSPSWITATATGTSSINVSWDDNAQKYRLLGTIQSGTYEQIYCGSNSSYSETGLRSDSRYYYKVKAGNSEATCSGSKGWSGLSSSASAETDANIPPPSNNEPPPPNNEPPPSNNEPPPSNNEPPPSNNEPPPSSASAPTVTTNSATNISETGATLNTTVNPNGASTSVFFDYGLTTNYGTRITANDNIGSGTSGVSVAESISGLSCGTIYHFRAGASNTVNSISGSDHTFTTTACPEAVVTTNNASNIQATSATLNAMVNPNGINTTLYFDYGLSISYGSTAGGYDMGSGTSGRTKAISITNLGCSKTYYFRARAKNTNNDTSYGNRSSFATSACPVPKPTVFFMSPHDGSFRVNQVLPISWSSNHQHHYGVYLYKDGSEVHTIYTSDWNIASSKKIHYWVIPSLTDRLHTVGGSGYQLKVVVWNKADMNADKAIAYSSGDITITALTETEKIASDNTQAPESLYADPIDTSTGAHVIERTLLNINGVMPLTFRLSYNSLLLEESVVGKGWGHNYQTYLEKTSDNAVTIYWTKNRYNYFYSTGNGQYTSVEIPTRFDVLLKNADGSFTLSRQNQSILLFNSEGQLIEQRNRKGQTIQYRYDSQNRLSKVTEPISGKFLNLVYNATGLVETVTDPLNRQVKLAYDDQQNLTYLTDAAGHITTYTYNTKGQVLTAKDAEGVVIFQNTYDDKGRVISQDDAVAGNLLTTFHYDETSQPGKLITTVTNRNGDTRVFTHNNRYQLLSIQDELGKAITTSVYDAKGNLASVTDANSRTTRFTYNDNGNLLTSTDAAGNVTRMTYDSQNNLLSITNALYKHIYFDYDGNGNLIRITNPLGKVITNTYNSQGQILTTKTPSGAVTTYAYQNGLLVNITDAESNRTTLNYDAAGRLVTTTDAQGQTTTLTYSAVNKIIAITNPLEQTVRMTYDSHGDLLTITDAKGSITRYVYDGNGNRLTQTNALDQTTRYEYDGEGRLVKVIDANGNTSQLGYDAKGRLTSVTDALSNTHKLSYDAADNLKQQIDALDNPVLSLEYDKLNNVISTTNALGKTSSFGYDQLNRLTQVTDPLSRVTRFNYDDLDRLTSSVDALHKTSQQGFDDDGNPTHISDPKANQTNFSFDKNGRLMKETSAADTSIRYNYNASDLLTQLTNARGQSRQFTYDVASRLTGFTDTDGTVSFSYDKNGNVLTVSGKTGTIYREYDALDRVVKYTDSQGNTLKYAYDKVGNLTTITYPDNKPVQYQYNVVNQLIGVMDWAGRKTSYVYDVNGRLVQTIRSNGTVMTRSYDMAGQLLQQKDVDKSGQIISQYDFRYDAAGNVNKETMLPEPEAFPFLPVKMTYGADNRLAAYNGEAVTFDADGNMTAGPLNEGISNFTFDSRNRLVGVADTIYSYDAENRRVAMSIAGKDTRYVINPLAVLSKVLVKTDSDGKRTFYVYGQGLIAEESGGVYQTYHFDLRGSTVALSDASGSVAEQFQYSPYGGLVSHSPAEVATPFLYNGRDGVMTDTSSLYYMRARFYNPEVRRFVNKDVLLGAVTEGQTLNRFAYVTGQPVDYVDPFGLARSYDTQDSYNSSSKDFNAGMAANLVSWGTNAAQHIPSLSKHKNTLKLVSKRAGIVGVAITAIPEAKAGFNYAEDVWKNKDISIKGKVGRTKAEIRAVAGRTAVKTGTGTVDTITWVMQKTKGINPIYHLDNYLTKKGIGGPTFVESMDQMDSNMNYVNDLTDKHVTGENIYLLEKAVKDISGNATSYTKQSCGPNGPWTVAVPDFNFLFTDACSQHDVCYGEGGQESDKLNCDNQFKNNLNHACQNRDRKDDFTDSECNKLVDLYYDAVQSRGNSFFNFTN